MCGIAGLIAHHLAPEVRRESVGRMCDAMVHRGPDDGGITTEGGATLGMRRLAIFDPANGRQPMRSPDGRLTLVFNGAIYNFVELRRQLAGGWDFRTECDTEVLLAAFARWGESCVPRLRGMFAFAVWDREARSLFLARDAFGVKPLYYRELPGGGIVFASEIRALNASGAGSEEIGWRYLPPGRFTGTRGPCAPARRRASAEAGWKSRRGGAFPRSRRRTKSAVPARSSPPNCGPAWKTVSARTPWRTCPSAPSSPADSTPRRSSR